ncbi:uncharacterized protein LOC120346763 [Styela clava]
MQNYDCKVDRTVSYVNQGTILTGDTRQNGNNSDKSSTEILLEKIRSYGDKTALVDDSNGGNSLTYSQFYNQIRNCAGYLYEQGLRKRDVVALCSSNCLEFPVVMLGIIACGARVSLCTPTFTKEKMFEHFQHCGPTMVISTEEASETVDQVVQKIRMVKKVIIIGESEKYITTSYFFQSTSDFPRVDINPNFDVAIISYANDDNETLKDNSTTHTSITRRIECIAQTLWSPTKNDSQCNYFDIPMIQKLGVETMLASLFAGFKLVFRKRCDIKSMLKAVKTHQVTTVFTRDTTAVGLMQDDIKFDCGKSSMRIINFSGPTMQSELIEKVERKYQVDVNQDIQDSL